MFTSRNPIYYKISHCNVNNYKLSIVFSQMSYWVETKDGPKKLEIPEAKPILVASFRDTVIQEILKQLERQPTKDAMYKFNLQEHKISKIQSIEKQFSDKGYVTQIDLKRPNIDGHKCDHGNSRSNDVACCAILWVQNVIVSDSD